MKLNWSTFFKRRRFLDSIQMFCSLSAALLCSHFQPSKYLDCFHYLSYSIGTKWENTKCPLDYFCLLDASSFFHDLYFARLIMTFTHLGYTMVLGSPERHEMYLMSVSNEKLLGQLCMVRMGDITTDTFMCHHSPECHRMYV